MILIVANLIGVNIVDAELLADRERKSENIGSFKLSSESLKARKNITCQLLWLKTIEPGVILIPRLSLEDFNQVIKTVLNAWKKFVSFWYCYCIIDVISKIMLIILFVGILTGVDNVHEEILTEKSQITFRQFKLIKAIHKEC